MISWISEVIHYLLPEGCVHVYGDAANAESGVPWEAVARCEAVPWKEPAMETMGKWWFHQEKYRNMGGFQKIWLIYDS